MKFRAILLFLAILLSNPVLLQAADSDGDGIQNENDNCPGIPNSGQVDNNNDGVGDVCPTAITGGDDHYCIRTNGGNLKCWGGNDKGQLGIGNTHDRGTPTIIDGVHPFKKVFANHETTCAAMQNGDDDWGFCWGEYISDSISNSLFDTLPTEVPFLNDIVVVKSDLNRRCAIAVGDLVFCWGENSHGQSGSFLEPNFLPVPFQVPSVFVARSILLGEEHTCAVANGNKVLCWGSTDRGVLGLGNVQGNKKLPTVIPNLSNVDFLTGGVDTTCAVLFNGGVKCWGQTPDGNKLSPVFLSEFANAQKILVQNTPGGSWCILRRDGTASCIGDSMITMPNWTDIKDMAIGGRNACLIRDNGSVWCWGDNFAGQLGRGYISNEYLPAGKVQF